MFVLNRRVSLKPISLAPQSTKVSWFLVKTAGPYQVINSINDVIYHIRKTSKENYKQSISISKLQMLETTTVPLFIDCITNYFSSLKERFGITSHEHRDLLSVEPYFAIVLYVADDHKIIFTIVTVFETKFERVKSLRSQQLELGKVLSLTRLFRSLLNHGNVVQLQANFPSDVRHTAGTEGTVDY